MRSSVALPIAVACIAVCCMDKAKMLESLVDLISAAESMGYVGMLLYIVVFVVATLLFVPTAPLDMAAGLLFSKRYSLCAAAALAIAGKQASGAMAFLLGRTLLRRHVTEHILPRFPVVSALAESMERDAFRMACMIRFAPMPTIAKSLCLAVSGVPFSTFMLASTLFAVPWSVAGALAGATLTSLPELFDGRGEAKLRAVLSTWRSWPGLTLVGLIVFVALAIYSGRKALEIRALYKDIVSRAGKPDPGGSAASPAHASAARNKVIDADFKAR